MCHRRCLLDWASPGCLGAKKEFNDEFARAMKLGNKADASLEQIEDGRAAQVGIWYPGILFMDICCAGHEAGQQGGRQPGADRGGQGGAGGYQCTHGHGS